MLLWLILLVVLVLVLSKGAKEMFATSPGTLVQLATSSPYYYSHSYSHPVYGFAPEYGYYGQGYRHGVLNPYLYNTPPYYPYVGGWRRPLHRRRRARSRILRRPWWRLW